MRKSICLLIVTLAFLYGCNEKLDSQEIKERNQIASELSATSRGDLIVWKDGRVAVVTYHDETFMRFYPQLGAPAVDGIFVKDIARKTKKIVRKTDKEYSNYAAKFILQR